MTDKVPKKWKQQVVVEGILSLKLLVISWVLHDQSSVLVLLVFPIFIDEMTKLEFLSLTKGVLYAEILQIFKSVTRVEDITAMHSI